MRKLYTIDEQHKPCIKDHEEFTLAVGKALGLGELGGCTTLQTNILLLSYFVPFITTEMMVTVFRYPSCTFVNLYNAFKKLTSAGYLSQYELEGTKITTRPNSIYRISTKGVGLARELFPCIPDYNFKNYTFNQYSKYHDYCLGWNFAHMLLSGLSFEWQREEIHSLSGFNDSNSLRIDGIANIKSSYINNMGVIAPKRIFFEQDMGTESLSVLTSKVDCYCTIYNFLLPQNNDTLIVFSFRRSMGASSSPIHTRFSIEKLLKFLKDNSFSSIKDMLNAYGSKELESNSTNLSRIKLGKMLLANRAYMKAYEECDIVNGYEYFTSSYGKNAPSNMGVQDNKNVVVEPYVSVDTSGVDMTVTELNEYLTSIYQNDCTSLLVTQNRDCYNFAYNRRTHLCQTYCKLLETSEISKNIGLYNMLKGLRVFGVPTNTMSNYCSYFYPQDSGVYDLLANSLEGYVFLRNETTNAYYPLEAQYIQFNDTYTISDDYIPATRVNTVFRNTYIDEVSETLNMAVVENISCDIGGYIRICYAYRSLLVTAMDTIVDVLFVAIVDTYKDAYDFLVTSTIRSTDIDSGESLEKGVRLYFILSTDVGKKGKLFTIDVETGAVVRKNAVELS